MKNHLLYALVGVFLFASCTRISTTDIGGGIIPPIDGVTTIDTTFSVVTDLFNSPDTIRTYKSDNHQLGAMNDPLFGKTTASMFFELKPDFFPYVFPVVKDSIKTVDSAVLILSCRGFFGDSTYPIKLNVFEIDPSTKMDFAINYPVNHREATNFLLKSTPLATPVSVDIRHIQDSVKNRFENANNQIRIKLSAAFAQRLIKTYDSTNAYASDSLMKTYFAGFAVVADSASPANALLKISLTDTNSKLALYYTYHKDTAAKRDTAVTYFRFNQYTSGDANFITHKYTGAPINTYLTNNTPDSLLFIQTAPGTFARIRVPGIDGWYNKLIHRAELIVEQVPDDVNLLDTKLAPPTYLLLYTFDTANNRKRNIPHDFELGTSGANTSTFGGLLTFKAIAPYAQVAAYTFNISRYLQGVVSRHEPFSDMRLSAPANDSLYYTPPYPNNTSSSNYNLYTGASNDAGDGRIRIGGGNHSRFRMRLHVIFSKL